MYSSVSPPPSIPSAEMARGLPAESRLARRWLFKKRSGVSCARRAPTTRSIGFDSLKSALASEQAPRRQSFWAFPLILAMSVWWLLAASRLARRWDFKKRSGTDEVAKAPRGVHANFEGLLNFS